MGDAAASGEEILYVIVTPNGEYIIEEASDGVRFKADASGSWRVYAVKERFTQASAKVIVLDIMRVIGAIVSIIVILILAAKKKQEKKEPGSEVVDETPKE